MRILMKSVKSAACYLTRIVSKAQEMYTLWLLQYKNVCIVYEWEQPFYCPTGRLTKLFFFTDKILV